MLGVAGAWGSRGTPAAAGGLSVPSAHGVIYALMEHVFAALARSAASGSRTTALAPLHMMLALVLTGLFSAVGLDAPAWVSVLLGVSSAVVLAAALMAYGYLLFNNPDALRSEKFNIAKMYIEHGLMGDTISGFNEARADESTEVLPASRSELES